MNQVTNIDVSQFGELTDDKFSNRFFWQDVPDGTWKGQPCFIIGGGPSLEKQWPWLIPKLEGRLTIGINRVYEKFDPTIIFGFDPTFVRWIQMGKYGDPARRAWKESRAYKVWLCTYLCRMPEDVHILRALDGYVKARSAFPFSMRNGIGHGNNSGYAALNLAACLGANPIYLIGYDMKNEGSRTHWHDGHPEKQNPDALSNFRKLFINAANALEKKGVKVVNLNPGSALECFPKADLRTALDAISQKPWRDGHIKRATAIPIIKEPPKEEDLFVIGPYGFGDTLILRSFVKHLLKSYEKIYVRTTLPEAFWDMPNVKPVKPIINKLRTQQEHIDSKSSDFWAKLPRKIEQRPWESFLPEWKHVNSSPNAKVITTNPRGEENTTRYFVMENSVNDYDFSFPVKKEWVDEAKKVIGSLKTEGKKLCIVRQPALKQEWANYARNPKTEYFQTLIDKHRDEFFFVSIAYNKKDKEWFVSELEGIDKRFDQGELPLTTVFGMIKLADIVLTYPEFFCLATIAIRTKCFCIFGGCAKPGVLFDSNMGLDNFEYAAPEPFCNCMRMQHDCNKEIPEDVLINKFERFKDIPKVTKAASVGLPPGIGDMHWVLTKLQSFKEVNGIDRLKAVLNQGPGHEYSTEFLKLVPFIDAIEPSTIRIPFKFSIVGGEGTPLQKKIGGVDYAMEFNSRLEHGVKLKDILPEYKVDFDYPIDYPPASKRFAEFIKRGAGGKLFLFYASSIGGNNNWAKDTWGPQRWMELAKKIYKATKCYPILVGAAWDKDYAVKLMNFDRHNIIHNLVGKTSVSEVLALIREANVLVGFLSGLVVIATHFRTPVVSFWPTRELAPKWHDPEKFKISWLPPGAKNNGFMPFNYGEKNTTPNGIFKAMEKYL